MTVRAIDRTGTAVRPSVTLADLSTRDLPYLRSRLNGSELVFRAPRGRYWLGGIVPTGTESQTTVTLPQLDIRSDRTVLLDARRGRKLSFETVDSSAARTTAQQSAIAQDLPSGRLFTHNWAVDGSPELFAVPSAPVTDRPYHFAFLEGKDTSTTTYNLAFHEAGRIPANLTSETEYAPAGRRYPAGTVHRSAFNAAPVRPRGAGRPRHRGGSGGTHERHPVQPGIAGFPAGVRSGRAHPGSRRR